MSGLAELAANRLPVRPEQEKQEAVQRVVWEAVNVEVKSPVDVVIVREAHAPKLHRRERERRLDRSIQIKSPPLDVAIMACPHLRGQDQPVRPYFGGHTIECARVRPGMV